MPILSKDDSFWDVSLGEVIVAKSTMTGSLTQSIELTLSLRKDEKEFLFKTYLKILKGIDSIYRIDKHVGFWEKGASGHRHIHSKISFKDLPEGGSTIGLIEEISKMICLILRRQYNEKNLFVKQLNYSCVPFKVQYNTRIEWDAYISKDNNEIDILKLCKKYKIYYKL